MTRLMYDSTTAIDIPLDAPMVAGYIDGVNPWSAADWARFPNAVKVRIARNAFTNDGHVLDIETGDAIPANAPLWAARRRAAGVVPTCYVNRTNWPIVAAEFTRQHVAPPWWWLSTLDGTHLPFGNGVVACQFAGSALSGGHFDLSDVADYWPGVDVSMVDMATIVKMTLATAAAGLGVILTDKELDDLRVKVDATNSNIMSVIALIAAKRTTPTGAHTHTS